MRFALIPLIHTTLYTDDLIDDQEYPSYDQGRVMDPDRGTMQMKKILLLYWIIKRIVKIEKMKKIPGKLKMRKITTTMLPIQTL
jgi:hypothetical protein